MKIIGVLVVACLGFITGLQAQQKVVEKNLQVPANKKILLNLRFGDHIKISAWDKKEASFKATYEINSGKLNEALLITFNSDDESTRVGVDFDKELLKNGKAEDCPDNERHNYSQYRDGQRSYTCSTINYEIFVPRDANLTVETISGNIELKDLNGPVNAKSISGFVDMNWPNKKGAAVALKTISGEVYSDLDINFSNKKENPIVGYELKGNLNGGGSELTLHSISGNVYLRKAK